MVILKVLSKKANDTMEFIVKLMSGSSQNTIGCLSIGYNGRAVGAVRIINDKINKNDTTRIRN
jgi:hypothetical protein